MISRIKAAFIDNLPNLQWMDDETRAAAVEKVHKFVFTLAFKVLRNSLVGYF